jgi:hypothetical protein
MVARHVSHADRTLPGLSDPRSGKRLRRGVGMERHRVCNFRGMNPLPPEHPRVLLGKMIERNYEDYGRLRGCLDWSVQQTCASWIAKHERVRLKDLNPNVFAGDIRQSALLRFRDAYPDSAMNLRSGPNCALRTNKTGELRVTVRKHPRRLFTGFLLPSTPYPSETLFGEDFEAIAWTPYVIWEADLERQVLMDVWLAAIAAMNKVKKTTIFDRVSLPPAVLPQVSSDNPPSGNPEDGNWPEWPVEGSGDEPA